MRFVHALAYVIIVRKNSVANDFFILYNLIVNTLF